ncbi:MAG: adenylyltransferase/cytidyltransferase family protein, partial [candidate division Zixibacteria bacterium]|nr:adenylyltransferase/cytidyltransferase family protein [candidate division Zixibacteria bacterium]
MTAEFFTGIQSFPSPGQRKAVVTVGTFDGIHLGHQEIFRRVQADSEQSGLLPVLVTFDPHPRTVVTPENVPMLLTTATEKARFIPDFFHGKVLTLPFDTDLMNMSGEQFVEQILIERIGMAKLIVGYDHAVGRDRSGNIDELQRLGRKHNYEMEVVQPVAYKDQAVSSSRIRTALTSGDFE